MTVNLRPHHLLCIMTYVGEGYSKAFTHNYDAVVERLAAGEDIAVVEGPDDICAPRLAGEAHHHCFDDNVVEADALAAREVAALLGGDLKPGRRITLDRAAIASIRTAFGNGAIRSACGACEWKSLCDAISGDGFARSRLRAVNRA